MITDRRAQATVYVLGIFPHGCGGRCDGCSGPHADRLAFVLCLGEGFLFDVCSDCAEQLGATTKTTLVRLGVWS